MKKRLTLFVLGILTLFVLAACGNDDSEGSDDEKDKEFTVGATQIVEHPSLNAAYDGFKEALKDKDVDVKYKFKSAAGDQNNVSSISKNFVGDNVDLIFANSTPSAVGALQATKDIPIVFTSVTDAVEAGLAKSMEKPDKNATGVLDQHPDAIKKTVEFIGDNFKDAKIGLIYNAGEKNSVVQIKQVEKAAKDADLNVSKRTVSTSAEVQQAANTLVGKVDVFYIITDNTVVSALESVVDVANKNEIPLIVGEPDSLEKGGFATYGIDFKTIGYRAGELASEILKDGKEIKNIPIEYPEDMKLFINKKAAKAQGVEWDDDWDKDAEVISE